MPDRSRLIKMSPPNRRFLENLLSEFRRADTPDTLEMIRHIERALTRGTMTGDVDAQGDVAGPASTT